MSEHGTWEGFKPGSIGAKDLGKGKAGKWDARSLLRPSRAPLRSINLVFDPKFARTRLGTRQ